MVLTPRKARIFQAIVEDYINFAEPVGSRTISKKINIPLSSATIRNEMSDLEEMGFIAQPHLSSGRVPTQKGLRFYVDCLMEIDRLSREEEEAIDRIKNEYARKKQHVRELIKDISKTLSSIMEYPSLVVAPRLSLEKFKKVQFLLLDESNVVVTLVNKSGLIENFNLDVNFNINQEQLNIISNKLNYLSDGFTLEDVNAALTGEFKLNTEKIKNLAANMSSAEGFSIDDRIFLTGTENIFKKPEFQNSGKVKLFIEMLNDKEKFLKLLSRENRKNFKDNTIVLIGNELFDLEELSLGLVASEYTDAADAAGILGVIGPSRMEYSRVISLVREIATKLSDALKATRIA